MKKLTEIQKTSAGILVLGAVAAAVVLILGFYPADPNALQAPIATIAYQCAGGREFLARVEVRSDASPQNPGHAEVFLDDGSKLLLTQTVSASGVRYTNSTESFVYWIKGDGAFVQEEDAILYNDCVGTER